MLPILNPYQNHLQNLQQTMMTPTQSVPYVNGRQSADNFAMQPNSSVILMDSTRDRFYLKKADASGSCTVEAYDFVKAEDDAKPDYVTRKEFEELKEIVKEKKHEQLDGWKQYDDASNGSYDARRISADVPAAACQEITGIARP